MKVRAVDGHKLKNTHLWLGIVEFGQTEVLVTCFWPKGLPFSEEEGLAAFWPFSQSDQGRSC